MSDLVREKNVQATWIERLVADSDAVTYEQFSQKIEACIQALASKMSAFRWHNAPDNLPILDAKAPFFLSGERDLSSLFYPFVQKIIVPPGAKIVVIGDLHGDIHTLIVILQQLREQGYLDEQLRIINPCVRIVFVGDYINRRQFSVPVLMMLFDLIINNPDHVILTRGNHESALVAKLFDRRYENGSAGEGSISYLKELAQRYPGKDVTWLMKWFDYIPVAAFVGFEQPESDKVEYMLCTHGGIEIGYDVQQFLVDRNTRYAYIDRLDRPGLLKPLLADLGNQDQFNQMIADIGIAAVVDSLQTTVGTALGPDVDPYALRLGMLWNNFFTGDQDNGIAACPDRRALFLGRDVTDALCQRMGNDKHSVVSVIRGHQHFDGDVQFNGTYISTQMFSLIKQMLGIVRQWDGLVYTLGASSYITTHQSFVIVQSDADVQHLAIRCYTKSPDDTEFSMQMRPLRGA